MIKVGDMVKRSWSIPPAERARFLVGIERDHKDKITYVVKFITPIEIKIGTVYYTGVEEIPEEEQEGARLLFDLQCENFYDQSR